MTPYILPIEPTAKGSLQTELLILNKLLNGDILELSAGLLDCNATKVNNKLETSTTSPSSQPPERQADLTDRLLEKCEDFETVCNHIQLILEQTKQILILQQQQRQQQQQEEKQKQSQQQQPLQQQSAEKSSLEEMDYTLQSDDINTAPNNTDMEEDEDMEELLQIQRDRLDRLRKVILLGIDADAAKANSDNKEDLLF